MVIISLCHCFYFDIFPEKVFEKIAFNTIHREIGGFFINNLKKSVDIAYYVLYSIMRKGVYDGYSIKKRIFRNTCLGFLKK